MDTQGTFDTNTTMAECSTVFALSTLLSSLQIYNVMQDVKRDDLDSLQLFVEYGKAAQNRGYGRKPFKSLLFLVRDWQWSESYQLGGGADFIDDKLVNNDQIRSCFEQISCFLLPYPWKQVDEQRSGLSDSFKTLLNELFLNILSWDVLESMIKDIDGETVKTKDISTHFKAYADIFQGDELPSPQSALDANVQIDLTKAFEIGMKTFETSRKVITGDKIDATTRSQEPDMFLRSLLGCREIAVQEYMNRISPGANKKMVDHYLSKLDEDTERIICSLVELNKANIRNEESVKKIDEAENQTRIAEKNYISEKFKMIEEEASRVRTKLKKLTKEVKEIKEEAKQRQAEYEQKTKPGLVSTMENIAGNVISGCIMSTLTTRASLFDSIAGNMLSNLSASAPSSFETRQSQKDSSQSSGSGHDP